MLMEIWSTRKMYNVFKFIIWCYLLHSNYAARHPVSPCPNVFSFEGEQENDRWSGVINFSSNIELAGLTYKIQLDRPSQLLVSWDGEVRTEDNTLYHVNNQYRVQKPGEMGKAQIMVKYDPAFGAPNIVKIVINGNTVCSQNTGISGNGGRVPSVGLSIDSTTERFDPSFNSESEDSRPDFPNSGGQNSNTNYGNSNPVNPNRIPTSAPNYANPNYGTSNLGNSNNPSYGNSNNPSYGNSNNPAYGNTNNQPNQPNYGSSDVHYPSNPPFQSGTNYGNNRPQYQETPNYNNVNPQGNWQNNAGSGNTGISSNPGNNYNNPQSNTPYNGTIVSANNPDQIIQLFNNLLSQRNPNASSPTLVVAILPVPSSSETVLTSNDVPITTEQAQKYKTSTFSTPTTTTPQPTSTQSVISRRNNTTTIKTNGNSNGVSNSGGRN